MNCGTGETGGTSGSASRTNDCGRNGKAVRAEKAGIGGRNGSASRTGKYEGLVGGMRRLRVRAARANM